MGVCKRGRYCIEVIVHFVCVGVGARRCFAAGYVLHALKTDFRVVLHVSERNY